MSSWRETTSRQVRSALEYPDKIRVLRRDGRPCPVHKFHRVFQHAGPPLVDFGMAISQGEAASAVVQVAGQVNPLAASLGVEERAVVDAVRVFVHKHPEVCGGWTVHVGCLGKYLLAVEHIICSQFVPHT